MMTPKRVRPHRGLRQLQFGRLGRDSHDRVIDRTGSELRLGSRALIGRAGSISHITAWLSKKRLVTVVGPGGVGKTAVALASAGRVRESYPGEVCLVDVSGAADTYSICHELAAALGIPTDSHDVLSAVIEHLKSRRTLVVLDSCERVIDGAAILAEELLGGTPNLDIIATSLEPLRARDEWVLRLRPLEFPAPAAALNAEQALQFPAIQLFVERVTASVHGFELHDTDVAEVIEICRQLDGLPLAIELAAARVHLLGLNGLAACLYDRPGLLQRSYRTAAPRHQSLRAMFDWSFETLTPVEKIALRRLALLATPFDLASATAAVVDHAINASDVLDILASLTAKSLLLTDAADERILYRPFETSRAFALEKKECEQDRMEIGRRHAKSR